MDTFCAQTGKTFYETAIEFAAAVFNKRLQQHGQENRNKTQLLKNLARFLLVFIWIHGKDKHDRLLVQFVLNGLTEEHIQNMDPRSMDHPCGPSPWTPSWTQSMDYPCGRPIISDDEFH